MHELDAATIEVLPRSARSYDGCDLRVRAPADARLLVKLAGVGQSAGQYAGYRLFGR